MKMYKKMDKRLDQKVVDSLKVTKREIKRILYYLSTINTLQMNHSEYRYVLILFAKWESYYDHCYGPLTPSINSPRPRQKKKILSRRKI